MHIAVILRIVPDLAEELEIAENGTEIDREWVGLKLNEFDDHALEEAVLIKEQAGARVTAIAMAGDGAERQLQTAIARGADDAILVQHDLEGVVGSRTVAHLLVSVLKNLGADVVMTGVQTPEDVFGQLAPFVAGALGWPTLNAVNGISLAEGTMTVNQEYSGGHSARFAVTPPVVLGIQTASKPPRYVSGSKLRQAASATIETVTSAVPDGFDAQSVSRLSVPERGTRAQMIDGKAEQVAEKLVDLLAERGLVGA
ncbi:electron transfer flavoprotein subunit beta/FixA family protein [Mesorhizobium sp. A623]